MKLLAIATSGPKGSLAIGELRSDESGGRPRLMAKHQVAWSKKAMHSELATVELQKLLALVGCNLDEVSHISVNSGPGSFTGIRVGLNLARTLAYGLGLPVCALNTLELLASRSLGPRERGLFAIKAVRNFFYAAVYENQEKGLVEVLAPASVSGLNLSSHAANCTKVLIEGQSGDETRLEVEAEDLVQWHLKWPNSRGFFSWKELKPLYIRASEAEEKLRQGLLKPL